MNHARTFCMFVAWACVSATASGQVRVHPTGVNVNAQAATTVFITFGGLRNQMPAEGVWCGELVSAAPALGSKCDPATVFGQLPARFDLSRVNGGAFTDIMSVPPSVARRAYQAAAAGAPAPFFYVRRFVSTTGGPDEFVFVICRLTSGGARTPFSLTDVTLSFDVETPVLYVPLGSAAPTFHGALRYNGTGRLIGRWEIVRPGEELPDARDLLPEASLPPEDRGTQRRYSELSRFNLFLPPGGTMTLPGPPAERLPTDVAGTYLILLRIEATDDKEADSSLALAGAGQGVVHGGGIAGFAMPTLRYIVGTGGSELSAGRAQSELLLLSPAAGDSVSDGQSVVFGWRDIPRGAIYRVVVETLDAQPVLAALVPAGLGKYRAPTWLTARASGALRWRVIALDAAGNEISRSAWRALLLRPTR